MIQIRSGYFFAVILAFTKKDFWKRQNFILFVLLVATFFASILDVLSSVGNFCILEWSYRLRNYIDGEEKRKFVKVKSLFGVITTLLFLGVLLNNFIKQCLVFRMDF